MTYHPTKIEPIFMYYFTCGFGHSLQKLSDSVSVTKKTLFNRYISKENMECCVVDYWQVKSCERMAQRMEYANNAVEKLMMFLFELQYCRNNEFHFFQKSKEIFMGKFGQSSPFVKKLEEIFSMGVAENSFKFENEPKVFAYFFQFNTLFILLNDILINTDYIPFLFNPILTEMGKAVYKDVDIEQVFKS
jgi:hypothetical protein